MFNKDMVTAWMGNLPATLEGHHHPHFTHEESGSEEVVGAMELCKEVRWQTWHLTPD